MNVLQNICNIIAVSGYEKNITNYIENSIPLQNGWECYKDNIGNLIYYKKGKQKKQKILFLAHIDEVGFQITKSLDEGKFEFKQLGNVKAWNLQQQRVMFSNGARGIVLAKDEANISAKNYENMYVKVYDAVETIRVGDTFTFGDNFYEEKECYISKGLDNRVGCYGLLKCLEYIEEVDNDVYVVFTVQEEIGMRGAKVAISSIKPDIMINIDVSPVGKNNNLIMGRGIGIKISDSIGVSDESMVQWLERISKENQIEYQLEVSNCGTSEMIMINEVDMGSKNIGISIPCENMHTANVMVSKSDITALLQLLKAVFCEL